MDREITMDAPTLDEMLAGIAAEIKATKVLGLHPLASQMEQWQSAICELAAIKSAEMPEEPWQITEWRKSGLSDNVTRYYDDLVAHCQRMKAEAEETSRKYYELIMQVGNRYPDETRHETALRYIRNAEANHDAVAKAAIDKERSA